MFRHQSEPHSILDHGLRIRLAMEKQRPHKPWCLQGAPLQKGSKEETFAALAVTYGLTKEAQTFSSKDP